MGQIRLYLIKDKDYIFYSLTRQYLKTLKHFKIK